MRSPGQRLSLTVAIPTYNRARSLHDTLAGLAQQDFPRDQFEILVIDNNSHDDTAAVVASFADCVPAPRLVRETRQGLDHARNRAILEAQGEIIVFGDDDILVDSDWLARLAAPLLADAQRRIGAVGGEVIPVFPDGSPRWVAQRHHPLAFRPDAGPVEAPHSPMGANLAFPRWVFARYGMFSPSLDRQGSRLFSGGDAMMIHRLRAAGLEIWFAPAARVHHQMPATRTTLRYAARHAFDSARSRVVGQGPAATAYLFSRFVANLLITPGFLLLAGLSLLIWRTGQTQKSLVRLGRSCGYLYQIPRTLVGKV